MCSEILNKYSRFGEYLSVSENLGKFCMLITKKQCAFIVGSKKLGNHVEMFKYLVNNIYPNVKTDDTDEDINSFKSFSNSNIIIGGKGNFIYIEFPEETLINTKQFECIKEVLINIKKYNDSLIKNGYSDLIEIQIGGTSKIKIPKFDYQNHIDDLIQILNNYVCDYEEIPNEVIIGRPYTQFKIENKVR